PPDVAERIHDSGNGAREVTADIERYCPGDADGPLKTEEGHAVESDGHSGIVRENRGNGGGGGEQKAGDGDPATRQVNIAGAFENEIGERTARNVAERAGKQRQAGVESHLRERHAARIVEVRREPIVIYVQVEVVAEVHGREDPEVAVRQDFPPGDVTGTLAAGADEIALGLIGATVFRGCVA